MLTRFSQRITSNARFFSDGARKTQMEVTIRSPYKTFLANYSEFSRIVTRSNEATLVI